jgi:hypothetical protein
MKSFCACGRKKTPTAIGCLACKRERERAGHFLTCDNCGSRFYRKSVDYRSPNRACSRKCRAELFSKLTTTDRAGRFWAKVQKTPTCWLWTGLIKNTGYGEFSWSHSHPVHAHRASYLLHHGLTPEDLRREDQVCHACDVRACVNPAHLWLVTALENIQDAWSKGRMRRRRGIEHHFAKLTDEDIRSIREDQRKAKHVAAVYGVSDSLIYMIRNRRIWSHVA